MKFAKYLGSAVVAALIISLSACHDNMEEIEKTAIGTKVNLADTVDEKPLLPKKEMRAVWMATVYGIDWPNGIYTQYTQKRLYTKYLDSLKRLNINTIFFQVRSMADAFYSSPYEPWSRYITGVAGKNPGYDVLKFMIDEAHKRCMSFQAWINPYRIAKRSDASQSFPALDSRIPKSLIKDYNTIRVFNPALPETRSYLDTIVKDLITKYDVDGIHMDDYFYPSLTSGESMNDSAEFKKYGSKFSNIADWRRDNVNQMVKSLQTLIKNTRREVVFSISPQGNVENDYNGQYADVAKWMSNGWLDVMIPQIYYKTGTSYYDFNSRLNWWASHAYRCALLIGYPVYRFDPSSSVAGFKTNAMLAEQFSLASKKSKVSGGVLYSTISVMNNKCDVKSVIRKQYATKALIPFYGKYTAVKPATPENVQLIEGGKLCWDAVKDCYYAVYRSNGNGKTATLVNVTTALSYTLSEEGKYFVTAVSKKDNSESAISPVLLCKKADIPTGIDEIKVKKTKH